jgi:hypothetical protein
MKLEPAHVTSNVLVILVMKHVSVLVINSVRATLVMRPVLVAVIKNVLV